MAESGVRQALHANGEATTGLSPFSSTTNNSHNFSCRSSRRVKTQPAKAHETRYCSLSHLLFKDHVTSVFSRPRLQNLLHTHHAHRTHLHIPSQPRTHSTTTLDHPEIFLIALLRPTSTSAIHHGSNPFRARCRKGTCRPLVTRPPALRRSSAYNYIYKRLLHRQLCACLF